MRYFDAALILIGALLMTVALIRAVRFSTRLTGSRWHKMWATQTTLMALFLVGYIAAFFLLVYGRYELLAGLISVIFAAGALFVLLTVFLATSLNAGLLQLRDRQEETLLELEAKNAELARFSYTVSHDLKNPLITIGGFAGLLQRELGKDASSAIAEPLDRIQAAAKRMRELLDDLLVLARLAHLPVQLEPVDLNELVNDVLLELEDVVDEAGVAVEIAAALPTVMADRERLYEVFSNLIENAIKFRVSEEPRVQVGVRQDDGDVVFVADNGAGIGQEHRERVFDLFERLDPAVPGTGVGLTVVKRVLETHGGRVWVESSGMGHGTCVCFCLPSDVSPSQGENAATA